MKRMNYYDKDRIVGYCTSNTWVWITYDESIKTAQDLAGKKVFVGRPGGPTSSISCENHADLFG